MIGLIYVDEVIIVIFNCVIIITHANFVIGLCAVKFARKQTRIELSWIELA
jgi:hypothetical protein